MRAVRFKASGKRFDGDKHSQLVAKYQSKTILGLFLCYALSIMITVLLLIIIFYTYIHIYISSCCGYSEAVLVLKAS